MGTGASAEASAAVQGASVEEMQAYIDKLPAEDREKLQGALAQAQAPAEGATPADAGGEAAAPAEAAAEEKAAPAEAAAEAAAAPAEKTTEAEEAPFLAEYFDKVQKRTNSMIEDQEKLLALAVDPEAKKKFAEDQKAWFDIEAKPLLEKSFKHHDTKNTDVLDKEEAAVFFNHMVKEETDFGKTMSALTIEAGIKMSMSMLEGMSEEDRAAIQPQLEAEMKKRIEAAQAEVQKKEDNYKANKADCDAAAFKVLDTNADGTIQLSEFLAAFSPDTQKNMELHLALGYLTKEEVEAQKKREEEAGGCAQQ